MYANIFYFYNINSIGGVETFFHYLAKKYQEYDITIFYRHADMSQVKRLQKYVRVKRWKDKERVRCKRAFFNYNADIIDFVDADEYIQIIHADYRKMKLNTEPHKKVTKILGVSEAVCRSYEEVTGREVECVYNPLDSLAPRRVLHLVSATRLTKEKGAERMQALADALTKAGVQFLWTVFTDGRFKDINHPSVCYLAPRLDVIDYIADADYLVQLSDTEAYCFSVVESWQAGTPVIITPIPALIELGANEENSVIVDFEMKDIPVDRIVQGFKPFRYTPKEDRWDEYLDHAPSTWFEEKRTPVEVECTRHYYDLELNKDVAPPMKWVTTFDRAEFLESLGLVRRCS